ncbi:hypothetical protein FS764_07265 [Agrobacterium vitis]|uniref:hypothetical protein n=1 Tax=Agrobacterium vitis TaxID=373 RepID=UPI001F1DAC71|nr:hypothetical protein [Agrobacterium vitis]MCF1466712.1 hypothetical protein [Agrobacterium vitis]
MTAKRPLPPLDGLKRQIARHRDRQIQERGQAIRDASPFIRETFRLNREEARAKAREWFDAFPKAAYWTEVESWRQLEGDAIEFTMRRLSSAD